MLAKYYPSTGWYLWGENDQAIVNRIDAWFEEHRHDSQWGAGFSLEFEMAPDFPAPNQPVFTESQTEPFPKLN